jgi:hypothetical protein
MAGCAGPLTTRHLSGATIVLGEIILPPKFAVPCKVSSFSAIEKHNSLGIRIPFCAKHPFGVSLLCSFGTTYCDCYLHGFIKEGDHPKPDLLPYNAFQPTNICGNQASFRVFINYFVWPHH